MSSIQLKGAPNLELCSPQIVGIENRTELVPKMLDNLREINESNEEEV